MTSHEGRLSTSDMSLDAPLVGGPVCSARTVLVDRSARRLRGPHPHAAPGPWCALACVGCASAHGSARERRDGVRRRHVTRAHEHSRSLTQTVRCTRTWVQSGTQCKSRARARALRWYTSSARARCLTRNFSPASRAPTSRAPTEMGHSVIAFGQRWLSLERLFVQDPGSRSFTLAALWVGLGGVKGSPCSAVLVARLGCYASI